MNRKKRSDEELRAASDHLYYECEMFLTLSPGLTSGILGESSLENAVIESLALHSRILLKFLYDDNPKGDDVIAEDFFDPPETWRNLRPAKSKLLETIGPRVGKEVAHLTYARQEVTPEKKKWYFAPITDEITKILNCFLEHVPRDLLGPSWKPSEEGNNTN